MPRKRTRSRDVSEVLPPSQSQREVEVESVNLDEQVNNLVRYFIIRAPNHSTFKRQELKKNVLPKSGQNFQEILNRAVNILREVYGYNVLVVDAKQNSAKSYVVSNILPHVSDPTEVLGPDELPDDVNSILTMLILAHIFMSDDSVNENSLYNFLQSLGIDVERRHKIFGSVKEHITTLKNKKYINMETDPLSKKISFSWGDRAEREISKHEMLKFVCKMYKPTMMPSSWISQYKAANDQHFTNQQELNDVEQATQSSQA